MQLLQTGLSRPEKPTCRTKQSLCLLPTELLQQIISYLPVPSILALRILSRSLYYATADIPLITQLWFGPYLEDRRAFTGVCNHPFLSRHVTTIAYDITRFADFSLEELRELWPRPHVRRPEGRESRKAWITRNPGLWQYRSVVEEAKTSSFDELRELTEGLKKLPKVRTVKLSFAFQQTWMKTEKERMSPLRMYSDIEWVTRSGGHRKMLIDQERMSTLLEAIIKSGVVVKELDFWRDYISVPLSTFNFQNRFDELATIFCRLKKFTIRISASSMEGMEASPDVQALQKLVASAKKLKEFRLCIDEVDWEHRLTSWTMDLSRAGLHEVSWDHRPDLLTNLDSTIWSPPWPGTVRIFRRKKLK